MEGVGHRPCVVHHLPQHWHHLPQLKGFFTRQCGFARFGLGQLGKGCSQRRKG